MVIHTICAAAISYARVYNRAVISCERNAKYLQKTLKTNESYLPLKRPSAGPFFKSILAEIYFTIYKSRPVYLDEPFGVTVFGCFPCEEPEQRSVRDSCQGLLARMQRACRNGRRGGTSCMRISGAIQADGRPENANRSTPLL